MGSVFFFFFSFNTRLNECYLTTKLTNNLTQVTTIEVLAVQGYSSPSRSVRVGTPAEL